MLKPLPAPVRPPQPPETIRETLAQRQAEAIQHTPFGVLTPADQSGLRRRTAHLCGVPVELVIEVCDG